MLDTALIYDLEIVNAVPPRDGRLIPGVTYCGGWRDLAGMGIACVCTYDAQKDRYSVTTATDDTGPADLLELFRTLRPLVSFNGINFDNKVLLATPGFSLCPTETACFDLFDEIRQQTGEWNSLGAVAEANLGYGKSGDGALAPVLWQQGQHGRVISYCLDDVRLLRNLWRMILDGKPLKCPKSGKLCHWDLAELEKRYAATAAEPKKAEGW